MRVMMIVLALAFAAPAWGQGGGPSFDCGRARTAAERAICADPTLAALDRAMAGAYVAARAALARDPAATAHLVQDQRSWLAGRDLIAEGGYGANAADLGAYIRARREVLRAIAPPRAGLLGRWGNESGQVVVTQVNADVVRVSIETADQVSGRWICTLQARGRMRGGVIALDRADTDDWDVTLQRRGALLTVADQPGPDGPPIRPHCGVNGHIEGQYLPLR